MIRILPILIPLILACGSPVTVIPGSTQILWVEDYLSATCNRAFRCCAFPTEEEAAKLRAQHGPDVSSCILIHRAEQETAYLKRLTTFQVPNESNRSACLTALKEKPCTPQGHGIKECSMLWKGSQSKGEICSTAADCADAPALCACTGEKCGANEHKRCVPYASAKEGEACKVDGKENDTTGRCDYPGGYYCERPDSKATSGICRKDRSLGTACTALQSCAEGHCTDGLCVLSSDVSCYAR